MRRTAVLAFLALVAVSCSSGETTVTSAQQGAEPGSAPPAAESAPATVVDNSGHPLVIVAADFDAGFVLIRNDGDADVDLSGMWLCNRPNYVPLPDQVLKPGRVAEVDAFDLKLDPSSGELALYTERAFDDPAAIIRYVQWGDDAHGRTSVAVAANVWPAGDFVDNQGKNIQASGSNPLSSADWTSTG